MLIEMVLRHGHPEYSLPVGLHGHANLLDHLADYEFIRALPPAGYTQQGEVAGVDFFPFLPLVSASGLVLAGFTADGSPPPLDSARQLHT